MLSKKHRLRVARDIAHVYRSGKRFYGKHGVLFTFRKNAYNTSRFAVIISKKYATKAHERNRQRRILQAALRTCGMSIPQPHDVIISYTKKGTMVSYKEACADCADFVTNRLHNK